MNTSTSKTTKVVKTPKVIVAKSSKPKAQPTKVQKEKAQKLFGTQPIEFIGEAEAVAQEKRKVERRKADVMNFAVQQLSAPKAPILTTPQAITQKVAETVAKIQNVRPPKLQQNGESKPGIGTIGCRIWDEIDRVTLELGRPATTQDLKTDANLQQELPINVQSIYARWRRFNGIRGRITNQVVGEYEGLTPIK